MLPEKMVKARLSFVPGKHVQQPNVVLVPAGRRSFRVTAEWSMEAVESYVIGSHDAGTGNKWCVLDADLKQVMRGASRSAGTTYKKAEPVVGRTIHGGGAPNPRKLDVELTSAKLKNGGAYTLVASRHGVMAACEFVAVRVPKPKAKAKKGAAKKKAAPKRKPAARKRGAKRK